MKRILFLTVACAVLVTSCGLSGDSDALATSATAPETTATTAPTTTQSTINFGDVQTFLVAWSDAEKAMAFEAFETERVRLEAEAEAQRQAEAEAQRQAQAQQAYTAPQSYTPGPDQYGAGCVIPGYICQRESGFNYGAVNASSGAGGMYQFMPSTWNAIAGQIAPEWIGVAPQNAPPEVQDQFASHLWNGGAGCSHWSAC